MFDVIVVGARCAGALTAMLLARRGHRVLLVDRARFPSDTLSTHFLQPRGAAMLARWGLLDRLRGTGLVGEDLQGSSRRPGRRRPWRSTWGSGAWPRRRPIAGSDPENSFHQAVPSPRIMGPSGRPPVRGAT